MTVNYYLGLGRNLRANNWKLCTAVFVTGGEFWRHLRDAVLGRWTGIFKINNLTNARKSTSLDVIDGLELTLFPVTYIYVWTPWGGRQFCLRCQTPWLIPRPIQPWNYALVLRLASANPLKTFICRHICGVTDHVSRPSLYCLSLLMC